MTDAEDARVVVLMVRVRCERCNRLTHPDEMLYVHRELWICCYCMEGR